MAEERAPPHLCARPTLGLRTLLHGRADSVGRHKGGETQSAMTGGVRERGSVARGGVVAVGRWAVGVAGGWSGLSRSALLSRSPEPTPPPRYANCRRPRGRPTDQRLGPSHVAGETKMCQPSLPRIADPTN